MRHSFATHLVEVGYDIRTVRELLGQTEVPTTMVYTHVLDQSCKVVRSPMDEVFLRWLGSTVDVNAIVSYAETVESP